MKKIILAILLCLVTTLSHAIEYTALKPSIERGVLAKSYGDAIGYESGIDNGITFYGNYAGQIKPFYFAGPSGLATFTRTTGDTATYIDSNGVIQLATATQPRFAGGYYDATGFHSSKGLMIEAAGTNRATYSSIPENAAWTKVNLTADNDDAGSSSPDGIATAPSLTCTNALGGTMVQAYVDAAAGVYTASCYIKRKTGTGVINLRANVLDGYTAITTSVLSTTWTRVSVSSSSLTNPAFDIQLVTNTDAVYIYGCQLEKNPYMTSLIPCPTTALTRNAEQLQYAQTGNITSTTGTILVKTITNWNGADTSATKSFIQGGTFGANWVFLGKSNMDDIVNFSIHDTTDTERTRGYNTDGTIWAANTSYVFGATYTANSDHVLYKNGSAVGTFNVGAGTNVFTVSGNFGVGSRTSSTGECVDGFIQKCVIFNRALSASEVDSVSSLLNS